MGMLCSSHPGQVSHRARTVVPQEGAAMVCLCLLLSRTRSVALRMGFDCAAWFDLEVRVE
ncbi:hypothetical protein GCM10022221_19520 [Actinocorallia aurea]